uniref:Uncharacterized protein n=1 Tax=Crocodylus porosus TaxID=8502 RepID=A0A7M4EH77_CROPO
TAQHPLKVLTCRDVEGKFDVLFIQCALSYVLEISLALLQKQGGRSTTQVTRKHLFRPMCWEPVTMRLYIIFQKSVDAN